MTIEEAFNRNIDMSYEDIFVLHRRFDISHCGNSTGDINGCIIYQGDYYSMPKVLKDLHVSSFRCSRNVMSYDETDKWDIWVV